MTETPIPAENIRTGDTLILFPYENHIIVADVFRPEDPDADHLVVITPEHREYVLHPQNTVRRVNQL